MSVRIQLAFDGSPAAQRAAELFAGYAGDPGALQVELVNVQARPVSLWPGAGLEPGALEAALLAAGREALAPGLARFNAAGIAARGAVRLGLGAEALLQEARAHAPDALVIGTRGAGLAQGYALGSVALRVAHGAAAPVVLVTPEDRLPRAFGKRLRVLLAMDGSAPALRAAERLVAWRGWLGELEVHLAHVQRPLTALQAILPPHEDLMRQWSSAEGEQATQAARELLARAGIPHHTHFSAGEPALELRTLAAKTASELVALGTRGLGALHHALVGSVSLKAALVSGVPVLLVP